MDIKNEIANETKQILLLIATIKIAANSCYLHYLFSPIDTNYDK